MDTAKKSHSTAEQAQAKRQRQCVYCGAKASIVWVHGHGQCSHCGINTEECCRGEQCEN